MEIMLATNNQHKHREIQQMFPRHTILLPRDDGIDFFHDETGSTFLENALGKAVSLQKLSGRVILSDDSGLVVPALSFAPGIYSARYGDPRYTDRERNSYLLKQLEHAVDRRAWFVCALILLFDDYRHISVQERVDGEICHTPAGTEGFGYDPVFFLQEFGCTMAELSPEEKHRISHRGKAGRVLNRLVELHETDQKGDE